MSNGTILIIYVIAIFIFYKIFSFLIRVKPKFQSGDKIAWIDFFGREFLENRLSRLPEKHFSVRKVGKKYYLLKNHLGALFEEEIQHVDYCYEIIEKNKVKYKKS